MNKLEKAKRIVKEYIGYADCGLFDSRNILGDSMTNVYDEDGLIIDVCYHYAYFEVFGLSSEEFEALDEYYIKLQEEIRNGK